MPVAFARRLISLMLVLLGLLVITFFVSHVVPADPARLAAGLDAPPEQVAQYRKDMGLDQPLPVQFGQYITAVLRGDLGRSISTRRLVIEDLKLYFPATAELAVSGMLLYIVVGVPLGIVAALQYGKSVDYAIRFLTVLALAIPNFVLALVLQLVLGRALGLFPLDGRFPLNMSPPNQVTGFYTVDALLAGDWLAFRTALVHLALPTLAVAAGRFAVAARFMRAGLLEVMREDFIRTARAKGLRESRIVQRHAVKNAMIPLVTVLGLQFGFLLGGIVFIEVVFSWPGLGRYAVNAIFAFDFPAVIGTTLLLGTVYVLVNFAVDLIYRFLDPRVSL